MTEQFVGKSVGKNENKTMRPLINIGLQALVRSPVELCTVAVMRLIEV